MPADAQIQQHKPISDQPFKWRASTATHTRTLVATSCSAYPETTAHTPTPERHPLLRYPFGDLRESPTRNGTHQPFTIIHNNTISIELNTSAPSHSFTPFALPTIIFFNLVPSSNTSRAKYIQRVTHWPLIDILSITSFLEPEVPRFHDATLTKQQIVRFDVLPFNNTSVTYSMNHTSHIKMKQAW